MSASMDTGMSGAQKGILILGVAVIIPLFIYSCFQLADLGKIYNEFGVCLEKCEQKYLPELGKVQKVQVVAEKSLYKHADCRVKCDREVTKADSRDLKLAFVVAMFVLNMVIIGMILVGIIRKYRQDKAIERAIKSRTPELDHGTEYEDGRTKGLYQDPRLDK